MKKAFKSTFGYVRSVNRPEVANNTSTAKRRFLGVSNEPILPIAAGLAMYLNHVKLFLEQNEDQKVGEAKTHVGNAFFSNGTRARDKPNSINMYKVHVAAPMQTSLLLPLDIVLCSISNDPLPVNVTSRYGHITASWSFQAIRSRRCGYAIHSTYELA